MDMMDQMVTDLTCALEETIHKKTSNSISRTKNGNSRAAAWAHRRSRSTSHLNLPSQHLALPDVTHKSESDDTSKGGNDSDDAERSLAKLSLQCIAQKPISNIKSIKHSRTCSMPLTKQSIVESDSVNELFSPTQPTHQVQTSQSKRPRRRHKRMAVEVAEASVSVTESDFMLPCTSRSAVAAAAAVGNGTMGPPFLKTAPVVICKVGSSFREVSKGGSGKKKFPPTMQDIRMELTGKRKRCQRDKMAIAMGSSSAPEAASVLNSDFQGLSTMDLVSMGIDALCGASGGIDMENDDEIMKSDTSSLSSSTDSECEHPSCDEGQEGDDEHSDWVGDEGIDDMDDTEKKRELIKRRLKEYGDTREIRAGKRKGYSNKPFSIRIPANEQLAKFLQNSEQSELKLHPMKKEERIQLSQLASLYSLKMHCLHDGDQSFLACPVVLTKTRNTQRMDVFVDEKSGLLNSNLSESDTKRIKM